MTDRVGLEAVMNTRASMFGETIRTVFVSCVSFQQENEEKQDTLNAVSPTIVSQKKRVSSHITLANGSMSSAQTKSISFGIMTFGILHIFTFQCKVYVI